MLKATQHSKALSCVFGLLLLASSQPGLAAGPKFSPIDAPPLDGNRAPSGLLVPWLASSGLYGYADRSGVLKIPAQYSNARPFYEGFAAVYVKGKGWGFIQPSGAFQIAPHYGQVTDFLNGKATASELREPVNAPFSEGVLLEGHVTEHMIDRRGAELKKRGFGANVLVDWGVSGRRFERYPEPPSDEVPGWQEVAIEERKRGLRRVADGKLMVRANEVLVVRDLASGEARFLAGHDWNKSWTIWDLDGKPVASSLFDVYRYASEGCFYASEWPQGWWAAYDAHGHRVTRNFANSTFAFRDGIAEVEAVNGTTVYVDRTGRMYVDAGYLEALEAPFVRESK